MLREPETRARARATADGPATRAPPARLRLRRSPQSAPSGEVLRGHQHLQSLVVRFAAACGGGWEWGVGVWGCCGGVWGVADRALSVRAGAHGESC